MMMEVKLVEVTPLSRGLFHDTLTYFSAQDLTIGAVVSVPVKNRFLPALVKNVSAVDGQKGEVKNLTYDLKKIKNILCPQLVRPEFVTAAARLADYQASPLAPVLANLLPQTIVANSSELVAVTAPPLTPRQLKSEKLLLQDSDEERLTFYKSLVREQFAKNQSLILCAPSRLETGQIFETLKKGIENYIIHLHPQLSKKDLLGAWNSALQNKHPILIVATPLFLGLPRPDVKTIILDGENSGAYRQLARPFIDFRQFSEYLAEALGSKLIWGDIILRVESTYRLADNPEWGTSRFKQRLISAADSRLVPVTGGEIISEELRSLLSASARLNERTVILTNRRGLAPMIVCGDCDEIVLCQNCQAPLVLHQTGFQQGIREANIFRCHKCGATRSSVEKCQFCRSWRLKELGAGIEKVAELLKENFPQLKISQLDSDRVKTRERAETIVKKFTLSPTGLLLGTEMALYYLKEKVENGIVIGGDSMLALPDFRIREKVFRLFSRLRILSSKHFLIQTRQNDSPFLNQIITGDLIDFYRGEIRDRRELHYPPFRLLLKLTVTGKEATVNDWRERLSRELAEYQPVIYPALPPRIGQKDRSHLLLRLTPASWPEPRLVEKLKRLPPEIVVTVDPETLT